MSSVRILKGWRFWVLWPLATLLKLWFRTLRFDIDLTTLSEVKLLQSSYVVVFWHNRLFVVAEAYRRYLNQRPMAGLVSASRDGAWLSAFFELCNIQPVRGSSSARGAIALGGLLNALQKGTCVAITPDGPRGPRYSVKRGVVWLAEQTQLPLLMLHFDFHAAWRLNSWDGFYIPKPFSRVSIRGRLYASMHELKAVHNVTSGEAATKIGLTELGDLS